MKPGRFNGFYLLTVSFLMLLFSSCNSGPEPIVPGKDMCVLCKMLIMDKRFGAEVITSKGKIYKFDSVECLISYLKENPGSKNPLKAMYVVNHAQPGELIDAETAFYLRSEKLPSPMGGNLSAVKTKETIDTYFSEYGGEIWTWEQTLQAFR